VSKLLSKVSCLAAVLLTLPSLNDAQAGPINLISNSTFDIPVPEGGAGGGWVSMTNCIGAGGTMSVGGDNVFVINECGQPGSDPSVQQILTGLTPGAAYEISGSYGEFYGPLGNPAALSFGVAIDGNVILQLATPPGPSLTQGGSLHGFSVTFVATSPTHVLSFLSERNGDDTEYAIDNIWVTLVVPVPDCSQAVPSESLLWPPNQQFVSIEITGVTSPDGGPVLVTIDRIYQDEPVSGRGDGNTSPDGLGVAATSAQIRAERSGHGNGRVYHIAFIAENGQGGACSGEVLVGVPHSRGRAPVDEGALYDSTAP
jgi:hypothetical protein